MKNDRLWKQRPQGQRERDNAIANWATERVCGSVPRPLSTAFEVVGFDVDKEPPSCGTHQRDERNVRPLNRPERRNVFVADRPRAILVGRIAFRGTSELKAGMQTTAPEEFDDFGVLSTAI